ncbi:TIGR03757 family integrating conjugative element protein [Billgrantia lactosivorans]|uniref:TIGR03757 family integrating conjugative element protein n=1 Tax=Billgrantia lactosivorans TaxID=2185141 RepID=UPI001FE55827|nr:TIGR03757 family integrating conjugative element protein [Halomonas lactosivorans]
MMQRQHSNTFHLLARLVATALALVPVSVLGQAHLSDPSPVAKGVYNVEIFTVAGEPVTNVPSGAAVIELDAPARLDAELSEDLPAEAEAAKAVMLERMQSPKWVDITQRYAERHIGVTRAWMLGVESVPAVVVDSQYVVYGEPDVSAAVIEILRAREEVVR